MDEDDPLVSNASLQTPPDEGITKDRLLQMMESELSDLMDRAEELEKEIISLKQEMGILPS